MCKTNYDFEERKKINKDRQTDIRNTDFVTSFASSECLPNELVISQQEILAISGTLGLCKVFSSEWTATELESVQLVQLKVITKQTITSTTMTIVMDVALELITQRLIL